MVDCEKIIEVMNRLAPEYLAEDWDNCGLIIGRMQKKISSLLISLDYTPLTLEEALEKNCQMVITHHPPIFSKIHKINDTYPIGRLILNTSQADINVYSAHTNLDYAKGGTGDALFDKLELTDKEDFMPPNEHGESLGRAGKLREEKSLHALSDYVREKLCLDTVKFIGDPDTRVRKVALMAGSGGGGSYFSQAIRKGADAYITGDIKYHDALDALALGLPVIDATHYGTEIIVLEKIKLFLQEHVKGVEILITETGSQPFRYI